MSIRALRLEHPECAAQLEQFFEAFGTTPPSNKPLLVTAGPSRLSLLAGRQDVYIPFVFTDSRHRQAGKASLLLRAAVELADHHQVVLWCCVEVFGDGDATLRLSAEQLLVWYQRLGFVADEFSEGKLTRKPKTEGTLEPPLPEHRKSTPEKSDLHALAMTLRLRLLCAYPAMECKKALMHQAEDLQKAAEELTQGHWRKAKLISWNHDGLNDSVDKLQALTGSDERHCREVLMNCAGNPELARRVLLKEPLFKEPIGHPA